jgi:type IV pilus assembly protein PilC
MGAYSYKGVNRSGKQVSGSVDAKDEAEAKAKIRLLGIKARSVNSGGQGSKMAWKPISIDSKGNVSIALTPPSAKHSEISVFTKQLSVLINAGVSVTQCFEMLSDQVVNPYMKFVLDSVKRNIQSGLDMSESLAKFPDVFDELYCQLVRAGSAAGALDKMLEKLADYLEKSTKLRRQLVGAITYPAGVIIIAALLLVFELLFVVPMFEKQFKDAGQKLPEFTQLVIDASNGLARNLHYFIGAGIGLSMLFKRWVSTDSGRYTFDKFTLKLPIVGVVIMKVGLARFATTMATLIAGGVALIETLDICARASGNKFIEGEIMKVKNGVSKGQSMAEAMGQRPMMPPMMTGMVRVGEASGQLDIMFKKVSEFYEDEVDVTVAQALKMVEPLLFVFLGGAVAVVLIAMYLPIFDLANTQSQ